MPPDFLVSSDWPRSEHNIHTEPIRVLPWESLFVYLNVNLVSWWPDFLLNGPKKPKKPVFLKENNEADELCGAWALGPQATCTATRFLWFLKLAQVGFLSLTPKGPGRQEPVHGPDELCAQHPPWGRRQGDSPGGLQELILQ